MSRWDGRSGLLVVWCALFVVLPRTSVADDDLQRARQLFKEAEVNFSLGHFERALEGYQEAYRIKPLPGFLFNIGQCQRNLGNCPKAIFNYRQYLRHLPEAANREDVEALIDLCEAEEAEKQRLRAEVAAQAEAARLAEETPGRAKTTWLGLSPWVWSGIGATAALLGTGVTTGVMALSKSSTYKDPATPPAERPALKDSGETLGVISTVTLSLAAASALGTVAYWWLWERPAPSITVAFDPRTGAGLVAWGGHF